MTGSSTLPIPSKAPTGMSYHLPRFRGVWPAQGDADAGRNTEERLERPDAVPLLAAVLVVEDDDDSREAMVDILQAEGYETLSAANGEEALALLRDCPPPGLILLDLMMPVMDGWEFRRLQQADPALAGIPVAIVSGAGDLSEESGPLAPVEQFTKPVSLDALLDVIARYCGR